MFNALGTPATQSSFVRWGYPRWWCRMTGALEIVVAVLIAFPAMRSTGLILGMVVILAAVVTVLRYRDFSHLAPLGFFVVLLAMAEVGPK